MRDPKLAHILHLVFLISIFLSSMSASIKKKKAKIGQNSNKTNETNEKINDSFFLPKINKVLLLYKCLWAQFYKVWREGPFWTIFFENDPLDDQQKRMLLSKKSCLYIKLVKFKRQKRKMVIKIEFIPSSELSGLGTRSYRPTEIQYRVKRTK